MYGSVLKSVILSKITCMFIACLSCIFVILLNKFNSIQFINEPADIIILDNCNYDSKSIKRAVSVTIMEISIIIIKSRFYQIAISDSK